MIIDFLIDVLTRHWKTVCVGILIASLAGFSWLQTSRLKSAQETLAEIQRVANEAQTQTENNLETIRSKIPAMVAQAGANAVRNYVSRYANHHPDPVSCPVDTGLRVDTSDSQAASAERVDETKSDPVACRTNDEFIKQCAATTALFNAWRELCKMNQLLCEVVQ